MVFTKNSRWISLFDGTNAVVLDYWFDHSINTCVVKIRKHNMIEDIIIPSIAFIKEFKMIDNGNNERSKIGRQPRMGN
jgi:hypothetical protein